MSSKERETNVLYRILLLFIDFESELVQEAHIHSLTRQIINASLTKWSLPGKTLPLIYEVFLYIQCFLPRITDGDNMVPQHNKWFGLVFILISLFQYNFICTADISMYCLVMLNPFQ